jgi:hypothetical protein
VTFIVTAVCVRPTAQVTAVSGELIIRRVVEDDHSWARAGYLPGLARYLRGPVEGLAYHLLFDEGGGYETSNIFFDCNDDDEPGRFVVPNAIRQAFDDVLMKLLASSRESRVILILEENGHVTSGDLSDSEAEAVDVLGPVDRTAFWRLTDLGQIVEDTIVLLRG